MQNLKKAAAEASSFFTRAKQVNILDIRFNVFNQLLKTVERKDSLN